MARHLTEGRIHGYVVNYESCDEVCIFDKSESRDDLSDEELIGQETDNFRRIDQNFVLSNYYFYNSTSGIRADIICSN